MLQTVSVSSARADRTRQQEQFCVLTALFTVFHQLQGVLRHVEQLCVPTTLFIMFQYLWIYLCIFRCMCVCGAIIIYIDTVYVEQFCVPTTLFTTFQQLWGVLSCNYEVASISRLLRIVGLFCQRALSKRRYSAKETYNFKEPTNRSHPIPCLQH